MKYKNIVFDFGNVVGRFDGNYILHQFCSSEEDYETNRLKRIQGIAGQKGMKITCHLAENTWRREIVRQRYQTSAIDYLYQNDLLDENVIGSHVVYATEEEIVHKFLFFKEMLEKMGVPIIDDELVELVKVRLNQISKL